jgi:hypothetical protein
MLADMSLALLEGGMNESGVEERLWEYREQLGGLK